MSFGLGAFSEMAFSQALIVEPPVGVEILPLIGSPFDVLDRTDYADLLDRTTYVDVVER